MRRETKGTRKKEKITTKKRSKYLACLHLLDDGRKRRNLENKLENRADVAINTPDKKTKNETNKAKFVGNKRDRR